MKSAEKLAKEVMSYPEWAYIYIEDARKLSKAVLDQAEALREAKQILSNTLVNEFALLDETEEWLRKYSALVEGG